jgi:phage shock protein PspC (stress-responsive transcriptional regulator)
MSDHLHRSRDDRMLAGVAGGLAEMWDADPSLVRIVWALLAVFTGGIALVVYIVMAIVVPEDDDYDDIRTPAPGGPAPFAPLDASPVPGSTVAPDPAVPAGSATATPAAAAAPPPSYWAPGPSPSRADARAARRAARRARRQRGDSSAPAIIGLFFVLIGGFFLARQWLPELDWDWFWPVMLIALGVLLLVLALGRRDDRGDLS